MEKMDQLTRIDDEGGVAPGVERGQWAVLKVLSRNTSKAGPPGRLQVQSTLAEVIQ